MKKILLLLLISFTVLSANDNFSNNSERADYYKARYVINNLNGKIVDNFGKGYENLYGTRNIRNILYGVAYRGGSNNYYHRTNKRNNKNPLPKDGLQHLANEGFSTAVYLYATNFSTAEIICISENGKDTLQYLNNTLSNKKAEYKLLKLVFDVINNPNKGPVYLHCWNGWHQSGYASAMILMQFCDMSNKEALKYWKANADGGSKGYQHIMDKIMKFKPYPDLKISDSIMEKLKVNS